MEPSFVRRLFVGQTSVVLVLVLSTLTAVIALRGAIRQTEQTAAIDHRLALLDTLERDTRELAVSGRSQLLTGGAAVQQRVLALADALDHPRTELASDNLDAALADYVAAVVRGATNDREDPHSLIDYEHELMPVRARLNTAFESIAARERMLRDASLSSQRLAYGAQWALLAAAALAVVLTFATTLAMRRQLRRQAIPLAIVDEPTPIAPPKTASIAGRRRQLLDATTIQVGSVALRRRTYWFTLSTTEPRVLK